MKKRLLATLLSVLLLLPMGTAGTFAAFSPASQLSSDYFIVPVVQQTTVPPGYIGIYTAQDLSNIRNNLGGNFILMNDIDLSHIDNWMPIGYGRSLDVTSNGTVVGGTFFFGTLDGNGFAIRNLRVYHPQNISHQSQMAAGLFGSTVDATIRNLAIIDAEIVSTIWFAGGFVGDATCTQFENLFFRGTVSGSTAGGIVGFSEGVATDHPLIQETFRNNSSFYACVVESRISGSIVGGLVGALRWSAPGFIERSYSSSEIISAGTWGGGPVGGLAGRVEVYSEAEGFIRNSYNTGSLIATASLEYEEGTLSTFVTAGGLVGDVEIGENATLTIENSFNAGSITAGGPLVVAQDANRTGGLIGFYNYGYFSTQPIISGDVNITNSYFLNSTANAVGGGTEHITFNNVLPLSTTQMHQQASFVGFDFNNIWAMPAGGGFPNFTGNAVVQPQAFAITIHGGTGSASAPAGAAAALIANVPQGQRFVRWDVSPAVAFVSQGAAALFVMPGVPVIATAVFEDIPYIPDPIPMSGLRIVQGGTMISLEPGQTMQLTMETIPAHADAPSNVVWFSENPDIATIDQNGLLTAVALGSVMVSVQANCTVFSGNQFRTDAFVQVEMNESPPEINFIFNTRYESTFWNWTMFFLLFGWIWMWF